MSAVASTAEPRAPLRSRRRSSRPAARRPTCVIKVFAWIGAWFGIAVMAFIVWEVVRPRGVGARTWRSSRSPTPQDVTSNAGGFANAIVGTLIITGVAAAHRPSPSASSAASTWPSSAATAASPRRAHDRQRGDGRAVDHRRRVRLRHPRASRCSHYSGFAGSVALAVHHAAGDGAHHRGHPQPGAQRAARVGAGHGRAALEGHARRRLQGGARRPHHRRHRWPSCASPARRRRCSSRRSAARTG